MQDTVKITTRMDREQYRTLRSELAKSGLSVQALVECMIGMYMSGDMPPHMTERALRVQSERREQ